MVKIGDEPYLKAAIQLGDLQTVAAHDAVYSRKGIELVERGVRVDGRLYQRLLNHKLQVPIDRYKCRSIIASLQRERSPGTSCAIRLNLSSRSDLSTAGWRPGPATVEH